MRTNRPQSKRIALSADTSQHPMSFADDDTFLRDDSELLLIAASALLRQESSSDRVALAPIVDFPSFQALLQAATSAVAIEPAAALAADGVKEAALSAPAARPRTAATPAPTSAYAKKRRERNRISCRKTRLKRKAEQARALLVVRKREEHGEFLSELHRALTARELQSRASDAEKARIARHLVVRCLHLELMDQEYDASWCVAVVTPTATANPRTELAAQWQSIAAGFAVADLSILQIHDDDHDADVVSCMWCASGTPAEQFEDGSGGEQPERRSVTGATRVRFRGQLVVAVEMRVGDCGAVAVFV
ncbi:hypothetical protein PybrP1_001461 [[Pythium] brassicae (nom. inval.)]|nr:hypothetical protein PybrP1_001461 [[Pythium] brassicae (nom. inval.)]